MKTEKKRRPLSARKLAKIIPKSWIIADGAFVDGEFAAQSDRQCNTLIKRLRDIHQQNLNRVVPLKKKTRESRSRRRGGASYTYPARSRELSREERNKYRFKVQIIRLRQ